MKKSTLLGSLSALSGLLVILVPTVILPVCEGMVEAKMGKLIPMRCFWTARAEVAVGGLLLLTGLLHAFSRSDETRRNLSGLILALGVTTILVPTLLIPTCMSPDMACNLGTKPALLLLGGITTILGAAGWWGARRVEPVAPAEG